jgi:ParB family transcriptional regulator, chromosome partitioning protein
MTKTNQKISLASTRDIPFNRLVLSQANVRTIKTGVSIEELAEDIARRGLLQSLYVRPVLGADGKETGIYEVPAGGRRYRALERLVKEKRLAKTAPVPCLVKEDGIAEEDSLAENTQREALHPVDQFRAFKTLIDKGLSEEEIAARFFVAPSVVKQRLRLAAVSETLIAAYVAEEMTLEQLMAFTVTEDHARQEQVWESLQQGWNREAYYIRRLLTEAAVSASDRRARFVGIDAYSEAGGGVARDLFEDDRGGWLQDPALLDRLAEAKLKAEAEKLAAEGWKWIAAAIDFPYGHKQGLRRLAGETIDMTEEEEAARAALTEEYDRLQAEYEDADELPDEIDQRLGELEEMIEGFESRPVRYDPADIIRAGAFISLDRDGGLYIERGYVRAEDEAPAPSTSEGAPDTADGAEDSGPELTVITIGGETAETEDEPADGAIRPLSDRLVTELTAQKTIAIAAELAQQPDVALTAIVHALTLGTLYQYAGDESCLQVRAAPPDLRGMIEPNATPGAACLDRDRADWAHRLPEDPAALWPWCMAQSRETQLDLLAFLSANMVDAMRRNHDRDGNPRLRHGDQLARAVDLDMVAAGWKPTVDNYLGRVPKARILEAVREGRGEREAQLIDHLKKGEMAKEAERLLADAGWLPEPLRPSEPETTEANAGEAADLPEFLAGDEGGQDDEEHDGEDDREAADDEALLAAE